mmetsp:Transcript_18726/g.30187  ORF Transcript_18726/g.30187 Transcript_18726/m.30187 type:complete len:311 (-) Transcript_18726:79-1011(-)
MTQVHDRIPCTISLVKDVITKQSQNIAVTRLRPSSVDSIFWSFIDKSQLEQKTQGPARLVFSGQRLLCTLQSELCTIQFVQQPSRQGSTDVNDGRWVLTTNQGQDEVTQLAGIILHAVPFTILQSLRIGGSSNIGPRDHAQDPSSKTSQVIGLQMLNRFASFKFKSIDNAQAIEIHTHPNGIHLYQRVTQIQGAQSQSRTMDSPNDGHHLADSTPNDWLVKSGRVRHVKQTLRARDVPVHKEDGPLGHEAVVEGCNAWMFKASPLVHDRFRYLGRHGLDIIKTSKTIQVSIFSIDNLESRCRIPKGRAGT